MGRSTIPQKIATDYLLPCFMVSEKEIKRVLQARLLHTDLLNVVEALGYRSDQFQQAFDIALEMENRNQVKLLYSNFHAGKVMIEFTLIGKALS
jgi:hypothetical protein